MLDERMLDDMAEGRTEGSIVRLVREIRKLRAVLRRLRAFTTGASRERMDAIMADEDVSVDW